MGQSPVQLIWLAGLLGCGPVEPVAQAGASDVDGDGYDDALDCNDRDPSTYPGAPEFCDAVDNDCDGLVDVGANVVDGVEVYPDLDHDGWGVASGKRNVCSPPVPEFSIHLGDCNDQRPDINPSAIEQCNGADDDCDLEVDEGWTADGQLWYPDDDGDGYGDPARPARACAFPGVGWSDVSDDCDDRDPSTHVGARDLCNDGLDQDCEAGERQCPFAGVVSLTEADRIVRSDGTAPVGQSGSVSLTGDRIILASSSLRRTSVFHLPLTGELEAWTDPTCDFTTTQYLGGPVALGWLGADAPNAVALGAYAADLGLKGVEPADISKSYAVAVVGVVAEASDCSWRTILLAGTESDPVGLSGFDSLPDVDGDGTADVWVAGREAWWVSGAQVTAGGTLYMGTSAEATISGVPGLEVLGEVDRDGDGVAGELLVTAEFYNGWRGGAWLLPTEDLVGSVTLNEVAAVSFEPDGGDEDMLGRAGDVLDLDGDGHDDIALGSRHPLEGQSAVIGARAYVFDGGALTGGAAPAWAAEWQFFDDGTTHGLGKMEVRSAGDLDGDGADDLLVAAPFSDSEACDSPARGLPGGVLLWYGGLAPGEYAPSTRDACIVVDDALSGPGLYIGVDDIDADGAHDVVVSVSSRSSDWGGLYRFEGW